MPESESFLYPYPTKIPGSGSETLLSSVIKPGTISCASEAERIDYMESWWYWLAGSSAISYKAVVQYSFILRQT